jgi:thiamine phosphate synthase YjbQ (UPF0047 family)
MIDIRFYALDKTFPDRPEFRHSEGNSAAHLKASVIGSSATVIIEGGSVAASTAIKEGKILNGVQAKDGLAAWAKSLRI